MICIISVMYPLLWYIWPPLASILPLLRPFLDPRFTKLLNKSVICINSVTCPLFSHIGKVRALQWHYLNHYWWFSVFDSPLRQFCPFCDISQAIVSQNYLRTLRLVLHLLSAHFYDILAKLDLFIGIICTIMGDFVFSPPFAPILPLLRPFLRPRIHKID